MLSLILAPKVETPNSVWVAGVLARSDVQIRQREGIRRHQVNEWPLQDIRLFLGCCARINHPFFPLAHLHCPPWCNTIARLLDSIRLPFRPPVLSAIHITILVITMSCKGQVSDSSSKNKTLKCVWVAGILARSECADQAARGDSPAPGFRF